MGHKKSYRESHYNEKEEDRISYIILGTLLLLVIVIISVAYFSNNSRGVNQESLRKSASEGESARKDLLSAIGTRMTGSR